MMCSRIIKFHYRKFSLSANCYIPRGVSATLNLIESIGDRQKPGSECLEQYVNDDDDDMQNLEKDIAFAERSIKNFDQHIQNKTVQQKYFKSFEERTPNMLTWSMKEQMRYLHATDPDRWTVDALSEAFPVTPNIAKKVLKSSWIPESQAAIIRHDRSVIERWKKFMPCNLGSASLLLKSLNAGIGNTGMDLCVHPVPLQTTQEVISFMKDIKFQDEENIPKPKSVRFKNKIPSPVNTNMFSKIITNYQDDVERVQGKIESSKSLGNDSKLLPSALQNFPSKVCTYKKGYVEIRIDKLRDLKRAKKNITFQEFIRSKMKAR